MLVVSALSPPKGLAGGRISSDSLGSGLWSFFSLPEVSYFVTFATSRFPTKENCSLRNSSMRLSGTSEGLGFLSSARSAGLLHKYIPLRNWDGVVKIFNLNR